METLSTSESMSSAGEAPENVLSLVCVECGRPVARLFREYNKGNIRLGRCSFCRSVADKYIECEFVLVTIDMVLHRVQAYRHLLFNRRPFSTHSFHGRLWQLGFAMAALDAHLRYTALTSEAVQEPFRNNDELDPFLETGGVLLSSAIEHMCFAGGAMLCAWRATAVLYRRSDRDRDFSPVQGEFETPLPEATKMYMALVYPMFFRLLAAFVMIWDRQVMILNTTEMLVATMQFVALSAAVGGAAVVGGLGKRKLAAAAIGAGLALKMGARGMMCFYFGADPRALRML